MCVIEQAFLVSFAAVGAVQSGREQRLTGITWQESWEPIATKGTLNDGLREY